MKQKGCIVFNSVSGRPKSFANVKMVHSISILDIEKNLQFTERVHLWTTIRVSIHQTNWHVVLPICNYMWESMLLQRCQQYH